MSRVVIGHKDGKPIYRDEGPNVAIRTTGLDLVLQPIFAPHRTSHVTGLPGEKGALPWRKVER